ncbi:unnamed protein product [Rhodiola kirilowii]
MEFSRADAVAVWYDIIIFTQIQLISYGDLEICCERGLCLDSEKGAGFAPAEILNAVVRRLADQKMDLAAEIFAGLGILTFSLPSNFLPKPPETPRKTPQKPPFSPRPACPTPPTKPIHGLLPARYSSPHILFVLFPSRPAPLVCDLEARMDCWGGAGVVGGGGAMAGFTRRVVTGGEGGYVSSCHICDVDWLGWSGRLLFCWTSLKKRGRRSMGDLMVVSELPQLFDHPGAAAISLMEAALTALSQQLSKLRTGRASVGKMWKPGSEVPLNGVAMVSAIDAKTLSVTPYDSNALKEIENAIVTSPLGLNPKVDGERLIAVILLFFLPFLRLTKEHIQAVCKVVSKSSEEVKQSIRRARQKALDTVKKAGSGFPKDEAKRFEKEVDDLTKKYIKSAEEMCKAKEKEILQG